jgi:hypothetical protein
MPVVVRVTVTPFIGGINDEIELGVNSDTSLGELRSMIQSHIGGRNVDRLWVTVAGCNKPSISFSVNDQGADALLLEDIMRSDGHSGNMVSVGAFRYSTVPEDVVGPYQSTAVRANKRAREDDDCS